MPRNRSKRNKTAVIVEKTVTMNTQQQNKKKGKRAKRRVSKLPTPFLDYAMMIADPCNAPLSQSISPTELAIVERSRAIINVSSTSSGYVVWFPTYTGTVGPASIQGNANLFVYEAAAPATAPLNTVATPMGLSGGTAGTFIADPAASFVTGTSSFSRQKTIAACMQLEWLGALSAIQGQVAMVKNISLSAFDTGTGAPGHLYTPMSVDQAFAYAQERTRTQVGGHEVVWRPSPTQSVYRTNGSESYGSVAASGEIADACFITGSAAVTATTERSTLPGECLGILIAWKGFPTGSVTQITCTKTFALELSARSGAIESIPRQISTESQDTKLAAALKWLDTMRPGWQGSLMKAGIDSVGSLAKAYAPLMVYGASRPMMNAGRTSLRLQNGEL